MRFEYREHEGRYLVTTRRCKRLEALVFSDKKEVNVRVLGRKPDNIPTNKYEAFELTKAKFQSREGEYHLVCIAEKLLLIISSVF